MADTLNIKRGETFSRISSYNLPAGDWIATSQAKDESGNRFEVTIIPTTITSTDVLNDTAFVISIDELITAKMPIGQLKCDIFFRKDGANVATPTFYINVVENQTIPPLA